MYPCNRPWGLLHFQDNQLSQMAVRLSALRASRLLPPQEDSWYSFLLDLCVIEPDKSDYQSKPRLYSLHHVTIYLPVREWNLYRFKGLRYYRRQRLDLSTLSPVLPWRPPPWSSGQTSWLQIQRSRVRLPSLPDFLRSRGLERGSTQLREDN
jgi:hypothetical protein